MFDIIDAWCNHEDYLQILRYAAGIVSSATPKHDTYNPQMELPENVSFTQAKMSPTVEGYYITH